MDLDIVKLMIKQSGRMWLEARDRSETDSGPIIVTESPDRAIYLERRDNYQGDLQHIDGWVALQQPLFSHHAATFYAAFGSEWPLLLRAQMDINGQLHKIRAFIKNGRKEGWTISLDMNAGVS